MVSYKSCDSYFIWIFYFNNLERRILTSDFEPTNSELSLIIVI